MTIRDPNIVKRERSKKRMYLAIKISVIIVISLVIYYVVATVVQVVTCYRTVEQLESKVIYLQSTNDVLHAHLSQKNIELDAKAKQIKKLEFELADWKSKYLTADLETKEKIAQYVIYSVIEYEGSKVVKEPDGGLSRYGINNKYHKVDVYKLTRTDAYRVIRTNYYDAARLYEFKSIRLQLAILHMYVLFGDKALNIIDGIYPRDYLKNLTDSSPELQQVMENLRFAFIRRALEINNQQYVKGWINRINKVFT